MLLNSKAVAALIGAIMLCTIPTGPLWAQTADGGIEAKPPENAQRVHENQEDLAKAAQNPVADMVSIPIQSNFNFDYGADRDKTQIVTNIQPVIPISLSRDWNHITRTIIPVIYTEFPAYQTGLGNVQFTGFFLTGKAEQVHLGHRPGDSIPNPHGYLSWQQQVERWSFCSWPLPG
jgi:hypothetical protein